jgi:carbon storage regulator
MLVLSRKVGERVVIGEGIVVTILAVKGGRVSVGFEAPESVLVCREELSFFAKATGRRGGGRTRAAARV